jgi:hypothetical protein
MVRKRDLGGEVFVRDIEFYAQILGLEDPWFIEDVELSVEDRRIDITLAHYEGRPWPCPKCDAELALYDRSDQKPGRSKVSYLPPSHPAKCGAQTKIVLAVSVGHFRAPR